MLVGRLVVVRRCAQLLLAGRRRCSSTSSSGKVSLTANAAAPTPVASSGTTTAVPLYEFCRRFPADRRDNFLASFRLHEDFVSEAEEREFVREVDPHLLRHKYETDHWDNVSTGTVRYGTIVAEELFLNALPI